MGTRRTSELFRAFNKWAFDQRGYSQKTRSDYYYCAIRAEAWLRTHLNTSLVWATLPELKQFLYSTPPKERSRNHYRSGLIAVFDFFVDQGIRPDNIAQALPRLRQPRSLPRPLPTVHAAALLGAARASDVRTRVLVLLFLYAGLRRSEARLLEWRHVEPDWLRFAHGKGSKERAVPVHPELGEALAKWRTECESARWVFPSPLADRPISSTSVRNLVREVAGMVGLDVQPHQLRHTAATRLLETGADTREVQEFLGHTSLNSTQIYTLVRPSRLAESVGRIDYKETP